MTNTGDTYIFEEYEGASIVDWLPEELLPAVERDREEGDGLLELHLSNLPRLDAAVDANRLLAKMRSPLRVRPFHDTTITTRVLDEFDHRRIAVVWRAGAPWA